PHHGIGFGALRYLDRDSELLASVAQHGEAELCFNYLGQLEAGAGEQTHFRFASQSSGEKHSPLRRRPYWVHLNGAVVDGCLQVAFTYGPERHRPETVAAWVEAFEHALQALLAACQAPGVGSYTPSDFPLCGLSQAALAKGLGALGIAGRAGVQDL